MPRSAVATTKVRDGGRDEARSSGAPDRRGGCRHFGAVGSVAAVAALRGHALRGGRLPRGHTNTVDVTIDGVTHPVDTGFLVFNHQTYPNLTALFDEIDVESVETEMSFSVSLSSPELEWAGSSLATVFRPEAQPAAPAFWRMLSEVLRFNRESVGWLENDADATTTLRDYLERNRYSPAFADWYLLPMAAAIWSCPTGRCSTIRCSPLFASAATMACCSVRPAAVADCRGRRSRLCRKAGPRDC